MRKGSSGASGQMGGLTYLYRHKKKEWNQHKWEAKIKRTQDNACFILLFT